MFLSRKVSKAQQPMLDYIVDNGGQVCQDDFHAQDFTGSVGSMINKGLVVEQDGDYVVTEQGKQESTEVWDSFWKLLAVAKNTDGTPHCRVRLADDLSRYHFALTGGQLGWTVGKGQYGFDVKYDCGVTLDTLPRGLELLLQDTEAYAALHGVKGLTLETESPATENPNESDGPTSPAETESA